MNLNRVRSIVLMAVCAAAIASGATIDHYPGSISLADWPILWSPVTGLDDPIIPGTSDRQLDFVGDANDPTLFHASDSQFVYFRVRVDFGGTVRTGSDRTFEDTIWLYFDISGWGSENGQPDYTIAWDSKGSGTSHGLELLSPIANQTGTWAGMDNVDRDGSSGSKISPPDINRTGDGFLRTVDGVSTQNFGATTFVDFAIRWSYLSQNYQGSPLTHLAPGQTWRIAAASVHEQTDHSTPNIDVAGAELTDSPALRGWSAVFSSDNSIIDTPEPATFALMLIGLVGLIALARHRSH